jgi:glycosyltransferase involved in cell wall biosynthesis
MPVFNGEEFVARGIESVLRQTFSNLELIVVDDGSTDGTLAVVGGIADDRITLLTSPGNRGPYVARNVAARSAGGRWLAFADADDEWEPTKLARQIEFLDRHPDVEMVHTGVIDIFPDGRRLRRSLHRGASEYLANLCRDRVCTSTVVLRRSVFEDIGGFDERFRAMGDWDLWVRVMQRGHVAHLNDALVRAWQRPGSIQRGRLDEFERAYRQILDRRSDELRRHGLRRRALAGFHYAVAAHSAWRGRRATALRRALQSLLTYPTLEALALLVVAVLPRRYAKGVRLRLRAVRARLAL